MKKLDFITGSAQKFAEMQRLLPGVALTHLKIYLPEIQEIDPHKIIRAKIEEACTQKGEGACIVEDTSFYLDAIPGLPGPLIKWFLETIGVEGLAELAIKMGNTKAVAKNIIGYAQSPAETLFFEGEVVGTVVMPRVQDGFGWDLIFIPEGHTRTFAEMTQDEKNAISHRARSAEKLLKFLQEK